MHSFLDLEIAANSTNCRNITIFYLINWIFAAETIQGMTVAAYSEFAFDESY